MMKGLPIPPDKLNAEVVLELIRNNIKRDCKTTEFFVPEHHRGYRFGMSVVGQSEVSSCKEYKTILK